MLYTSEGVTAAGLCLGMTLSTFEDTSSPANGERGIHITYTFSLLKHKNNLKM